MNKPRTQGAVAILLAAGVVSSLMLSSHVTGVQAQAAMDPVLEWNINMVQAVSTITSGGAPQARAAAIVEAAVYDAVVSFTQDAEPYADIHVTPPPGASVDAAAIAAAHFALVGLFPGQKASLDALYTSSLATRRLTTADPGVEVGEEVASRILALRAADGSASAQFPYTAPGAGNPGVWVPTPPAFAPASLPGWRYVTPWVMRRGSQFRVPPPPDVNSDHDVQDVEEARDFGALNSITRTPYQTTIAKWWPASGTILWNPIARQVAVAKGLTISENARLFALLNITSADAAIACWDSKYTYNRWRPITAIRNADGIRVAPDPKWQPMIATPAHPEYPSFHNVISGSMAQILIALFGNTPGVTIIAHSPANPAFDHVWTQFSQGIDEVIDARVWEGIHFRNSDEQGMRAGRCLGQFVVRHALRPRGQRDDWDRGEAGEEHHDKLRCSDLGRVEPDL